MPKFKGFKVIVMLCLVAFLFCGCNNFRLSSSIDDLISPISPSGDNAGVRLMSTAKVVIQSKFRQRENIQHLLF